MVLQNLDSVFVFDYFSTTSAARIIKIIVSYGRVRIITRPNLLRDKLSDVRGQQCLSSVNSME